MNFPVPGYKQGGSVARPTTNLVGAAGGRRQQFFLVRAKLVAARVRRRRVHGAAAASYNGVPADAGAVVAI